MRDPGKHDDYSMLAAGCSRDAATDAAGQEATGDPGSKKNHGMLLPDRTGSLESVDGKGSGPEGGS